MSITVCGLMRNEKNSIGRMLRSAKEILGDELAGVVLADTGSTDTTIKVAKAVCQDIGVPHTIVEHEWQDFASNRNLLLDVVQAQDTDFLLMLDPDMTLEGTLPELSGDGYEMDILGVGEICFTNPRLLSNRRRWRYSGVVHEAIADYPGLPKLDGLRIRHHGIVNHSTDGRFERDRKALTDQIDRRGLFYLAQTERDMGNSDRAAELYELRASFGGWEEEVYYSLYQAGVIKRSIETLIRAFESRPTRGEALYHLIGLLRHANAYQTAHAMSLRGLTIALPSDVLFVEPWIHNWGLLFEAGITSYWVGDFRTCVRINQELLERDDLFPTFREQTERNLELGKVKIAG